MATTLVCRMREANKSRPPRQLRALQKTEGMWCQYSAQHFESKPATIISQKMQYNHNIVDNAINATERVKYKRMKMQYLNGRQIWVH